jgi:hypothetical protein
MTFYHKFFNTAYDALIVSRPEASLIDNGVKRLRDCVALNHFDGTPSKHNDFGIFDAYLNKVMDSR